VGRGNIRGATAAGRRARPAGILRPDLPAAFHPTVVERATRRRFPTASHSKRRAMEAARREIGGGPSRAAAKWLARGSAQSRPLGLLCRGCALVAEVPKPQAPVSVGIRHH
jgi:hypothetical protein